jgi:hypothetical protein
LLAGPLLLSLFVLLFIHLRSTGADEEEDDNEAAGAFFAGAAFA